ncbi:hypothetical protein G4B88_014291 [Cannabis sativa]|uniref:Zinc knuckle CX2CX4HX4C domain-containing protein n=1 Tax=Cannabis sativa TaxID=3483 RepID=A0A7J6I9K4_CANSA|nr:hypothetical protein G4B88_014291 [Cannabis sativa]
MIEIDIAKPLFPRFYFDLVSSVKRWLQFKKIGIFCYNCGCLGHQHRGISLSSPVTVIRHSFPPVNVGNGDGGFKGPISKIARSSRRVKMVTSCAPDAIGKSQQAMWITKPLPRRRMPPVATSGNGVGVGCEEMEKRPANLPKLVLNNFDHLLNEEKSFKILDGSEVVQGSMHKLVSIGPVSSSFGPGFKLDDVIWPEDVNHIDAQDTLLQELKQFGRMDLYEIQALGGDIGAKPTSKTNA